jgi:hypothetical protein
LALGLECGSSFADQGGLGLMTLDIGWAVLTFLTNA